MTIKEFRFNCLKDIKNIVEDIELVMYWYNDESNISTDDEMYLKRYAQDVVNALDKLKSWIIEDLDVEE